MAVLNPLKLVIVNVPKDTAETVEVPIFPHLPERGSRTCVFGATVFIDQRDYRENAEEDYFGLTPGGVLGLRYANPVVFKQAFKDAAGNVTEIHVELDREKKTKPKTWVNWVSESQARPVEVRIYNDLFTEEKVDDDLWESQLNAESEVVLTKAVVDASLGTPVEGSVFQFEREGYFVVDKDSTSERLVFNRTVTLIESGLKKKEGGKDRSRKEELERSIQEKQKKMTIDPRDMFKSQTDLYSKFDEDGVPTHDATGAPISKSSFKKLKKDWEKQKKLFEQKVVPENWKRAEAAEATEATEASEVVAESAAAPAVSETPAPTPEPEIPVDVSKYDVKLVKAVEKEGGKKGQDILGVSEMGGLQFFCTSVDTPDGDLNLVNLCLNGMNKEVDESSEERRGGAGDVGKMLFSSGVHQLAIVVKIPQNKADKVDAGEWITHVASLVGGEVIQPLSKTYGQAVVKANPAAGIFPIKVKDIAIPASVVYLQERGLMPADSGDDDDICYGDDDF